MRVLLLLGALLLVPLAAAQSPTPGDYNSTAPSDNASYDTGDTTPAGASDPSNASDPTLNGSDMDTSVPPDDTGYLNDSAVPDAASVPDATTPADASPSASASPSAASPKAPGFEPLLLVAGLGAAALASRYTRGG
jgi:hypothetical protein